MNEQVRVIAKDGTVETIEAASELLVVGSSANASVREVAPIDILAHEIRWLVTRHGVVQEIPNVGSLSHVESHGEPAEPEIADK